HVVTAGRPLGSPVNRRARSVLKYLVLHRGRSTPRDVLMDLLWPDSGPHAAVLWALLWPAPPPQAARNNLNVAVHGLRRFLRGADERGAHVLFVDGVYPLNPELDLWVDLTEFEVHLAAGRRRGGHLRASVRRLEAAE